MYSSERNPIKMSKAEWENNEEIKIFREYLRIPTVHPNVDYSESADSIKIVSYLYRWNINKLDKTVYILQPLARNS